MFLHKTEKTNKQTNKNEYCLVCPREDQIKEYGRFKYNVCCNRPLLLTKYKNWQMGKDHPAAQYAKLF